MKLKRWLDTAGWGSQTRMAEALDVGCTTISQIANGNENSGIALALEIEAYTGGEVTAEEIHLSPRGKRALQALRVRSRKR